MTRRGFTLIEVLIAIGLLVLLSGLLAGFGVTLADRRDHLTRVGDRVGSVSTVFGQIDAALTAADAHGSGVAVTESELTITSRHLVATTVLTEFDEFSLRFDGAGQTLTASRSAPGRSLMIDGIERVRFRAYDGSTWGDFSGGTLPQAIEVAVWFAPASGAMDDVQALADQPAAPAESETSEPSESPPDRWRVFGLVDTLPEVGS